MSKAYTPAILLLCENGTSMPLPAPPSVGLVFGTTPTAGATLTYRMEYALAGDFLFHSARSSTSVGKVISYQTSIYSVSFQEVPGARAYRIFRAANGANERCIYNGDGRDIRMGSPAYNPYNTGNASWGFRGKNDFVFYDLILPAQVSDNTKLQGWTDVSSHASNHWTYDILDLRKQSIPDVVVTVLSRAYTDMSKRPESNVNEDLTTIEHPDEAEFILRIGFELGKTGNEVVQQIWNAKSLRPKNASDQGIRTFLSLNYSPEITNEFDPFRAPVTWTEVILGAQRLALVPQPGKGDYCEVTWPFFAVKTYQTIPSPLGWSQTRGPLA